MTQASGGCCFYSTIGSKENLFECGNRLSLWELYYEKYMIIQYGFFRIKRKRLQGGDMLKTEERYL